MKIQITKFELARILKLDNLPTGLPEFQLMDEIMSPSSAPTVGPIPALVFTHMRNNDKIMAIKELLAKWNIGLKAAKDVIESFDGHVRF